MNIFYRMTRENISPISHLSTPIGQTLSYWTDVSALCARTTRRGVTAYMGVGSVQSCPRRVRPTWERQIYSSAIILLATLVLRSDQSFMAWWDILGSSSFPTIIQTTNFASQIYEKIHEIGRKSREKFDGNSWIPARLEKTYVNKILAYRSGQFEVLLRKPIEPHLLSRYLDNLWHH